MQTNKHKMAEESEESLIQQIVTKYIPYWPLFLLAIVVAVGIAFVYLRYTVPIYEATAVLIIKDEKKGNQDSKMMESLDLISSKKIVENEIEIIKSRTLMVNVAKSLFLYAPVTEMGKLHAISAYILSPLIIQCPNPDSLQEFEKIYLSYNKNNQTVLLNNKHRYPINQIVTTPYGILKFVPNKYYRNDDDDTAKKQLYFSLSNPKDIVQGLLDNLKAEPSSKLSSVIEMSYRDEVPRRAEDILNQLIIAYDVSTVNEKDKLARNTLSFVAERLGAVAHDLDSIEKKVQQYKSGQGAVDVGTQGQLFLQNVSANDQKLSEVNMQLSVLNQVQKFVTDQDNKGAIVPSTLGVSDPMLSQLLDKLYNSELEYERLKKTVGENNPTLVSITDEINKIKPNILQNIQSQQQSLNAAKQNLYSTNGNYNSMLQSVPQKERQLLDISREQATKSNIYAFLLQKKEESELSYASMVSDHMLVDNAQAGSKPVSPKKVLIYLIAVVACLGFSFAMIMIRESLTGKVLYRHEVESRTSIPIIGEIAFFKSKIPLVIESGKRSFVAEQFRKLRISLSFLGIDPSHRKILVTSSISGEGKSFIAANLAVSLSLTGKKVVLVDLDLNNPTLSKILNVNQNEGITDFLTGEKEPEEIIKRVKAHENLFFISAGGLPESPTELLANGKVKEIIEYLDNIFDVVIIDTSPIVLVTDGYLLTGLCDATLYVIRHKYTPKMLVKRIDENNQITPINNPAIIFNGVKMRGFFKNNYGYGYDYVYGNKQRDGKDKKSIKKY
ncbi:MAG: polysaccharide biosynthesis tyrosine autokinase [Ginsengibacter sp.]